MGKLDGLEDKGCNYINPKTKERCKGYHQKDSLFCFSHDPEKGQLRAMAVSKGGQSKAFVAKLTAFKIEKTKDVTISIVRALNELRNGEVPPQVANSFFYGINVLLKAYELNELEEKIEELETALGKRR